MSEPQRDRARRSIVYLAGNDVFVDARVLKYAASAHRLGYEVTCIGVTRHGPGSDQVAGFGRVVVVATKPTPLDRLRSKWREVRVVLRFGYADDDALRQARGQAVRWGTTAQGATGWRRAVLTAVALGGRAWLAAFGRFRRGRPHVDEGSWQEREQRVEAILSASRPGRWRQVLPSLVRDEAAIGPILDELAPDVIHVHDVFQLSAATAAAERARAAGRRVRLVYDAHEYVRGLAHVPVVTVAAYTQLEREHIGRVDRVVTVSEPLADLLHRDHTLAERPLVVLNAPDVNREAAGPTLREVTGVAEAPLLVYGGGVNPARGVDTAVRALGELDGVHLAVVVNRVNYVVRSLLELAADLGVADRVHLADYVPAGDVPHYFSDATVGLSTLLHSPNHDVALTNKFCEYLNAGLPIVTSDTPAQAVLVRELRLGAVYPAGDVAGFVRAVSAVLDGADDFAQRIRDDAGLKHRFSWSRQSELIADLYRELAGPPEGDG